nr:hypothetical protein [Tanacetum cinerariifolium]
MPFPSESEKARFTTPNGGYEVGESFVVAAARQIRPALTVDNSGRTQDRLIGKLRRDSTLVTQIEALQMDVSTLQGQQIDDGDRQMRHIQHEHAQMEVAPEDDYIPGLDYPEYLSPADDVFPAEEQPLPADVSPTAE